MKPFSQKTLSEKVADARAWFTADRLDKAMMSPAIADKVSVDMIRVLIVATREGPATHSAPTGAGDYDIVCDGCGEIVADPHSWAECCAAQKKMVASLHEKLIERDDETTIVIPTDATKPLRVTSGGDTFELRIEDSPFINRPDIERILKATSEDVVGDIRDLLSSLQDDFDDVINAASSAHYNKGNVDVEHQCYRTAFWRLAGTFAVCAINFDAALRRMYGMEPIPEVDNDARELAFRGYDGRCECGESTTNSDSVCDECREDDGDE